NMKKLSMQRIQNWFKRLRVSKNLKYSTIVFALIVAVTGIAVLLNLFAGMAADKFNLKLDLTPTKLYTIGDDTDQILGNLKKEVTIYGMFDNGRAGADEAFPDAANLLDQYDDYSHVKVEYIDLDRTPGFIVNIDPDNSLQIGKNEFVIECGKKLRKLDAYDLFQIEGDEYYGLQATGSNAEQAFTGAILYVTSDDTPVIYFSTGHGEPELDTYYSGFKELLERNNYDIKTLNLLTEEEVPEDALAVVLLSPQKDIIPAEKEKLQDYLLKRSGRAMFFVDPIAGNEQMTELNSLLGEFNVSVNYDTVKENNTDMYYPMSQYYLVPMLQNNEITSALNPNSFLMLVPGARSLQELKNNKEYISVTSLLKTSSSADSISTEAEEKNSSGTYDLAFAAEYEAYQVSSKILLVGNSVFIADEVLGSFGNSGLEFVRTAVSWMDDEREDIFIAPKMYPVNNINMNATTVNLFTVILVLLLPLIIMGTGVYVFLRRRHL
ncbi:MAG: GldG family protein, partial [Eubacteriales bacterium]|nr:GldG family protein [Eubacteriales bacterium]